jgi:hypothetical protein
MKNTEGNEGEDWIDANLAVDVKKELEVMKTRKMTESTKEHFGTVLDKELEEVEQGGSRLMYYIMKYLINPIRLSAVKDESLDSLKASV